MKVKALSTGLLIASFFALASQAQAQKIEYLPEEFSARRRALCESLGHEGHVLMFGKTVVPAGIRFRQDNDFYYLTGNENLNAILFMDASSCTATLFLPAQTEREASRDGWNMLYQEGAAEEHGLGAVHPLSHLQEFLARNRTSGQQNLYVRLSESTEVDQSRTDMAIFTARRMANPFGAFPSEDAWRAKTLKERFPYYDLRDIAPHIDALRMIKTDREIEALKRNGWVSAEAHIRAIGVTRVGGWEYEIEAEATRTMLHYGAEGAGYNAIVGSGPNSNVWHYQDSDRQLQDGDIIVMDYGADMGYLTMDITRTWPASGAFTELQERAYRCVLEAEKAIIAAMVPGVTRQETMAIAEEIFERWGFPNQYPGGAGHFVGMSVHDVGDYDLPLQAGMVIAVEPIIDIPEEDLHIRVEDTVLVTEAGPVILSAHVPKEVDEVLALVGNGAGTNKP
ncbi:MAG: Xaa-Pro peptidase family protein [Gemmatimonadota bacterium]|jgi:Xaa-Pro aminopeptidase